MTQSGHWVIAQELTDATIQISHIRSYHVLIDVFLFVLAAIVSLGFVMLLYRLINGFLRSLLDDLLDMPAATSFYSRLLLVSMVIIGIAGISDASFEGLGEDAEIMEYVWQLIQFFEAVLTPILIIVALFLVAVTVLVAALKPRSEQ